MPSFVGIILLLSLFQFSLAASDDPAANPLVDAVEDSVNLTEAKTLLPPEPTDQTAISTAYFNQKVNSRFWKNIVIGSFK
jgi:hypothetical protein